MGFLNRLAMGKHFLRSHVYAKRVDIRLNEAIFSFTFDDVPVSAVRIGGELLNKYGYQATYYFAMGMATPQENRDSDSTDFKRGEKIYFCGPDEIALTQSMGHDVGCHSFSHKRQSKISSSDIYSDYGKNRALLENIVSVPVLHCSYPYGDVNLRAKKNLRHDYRSIRSTSGGINVGNVDLSYLKAFQIYSNKFNRDRLLSIIDSTIECKGWTIFYTHEVCANPNQWGTTAKDFEWLLKQLKSRAATVLPVSAVIDLLDCH